MKVTLKERLKQHKEKEPLDVDGAVEQSYLFDEEEHGMVHPTTKATLRFRNNGAIEMFTKGYTGIVLSGENRSANIFAEKINFQAGKELRMLTDDLGLLWNYYVMNPDIRTVPLVEMTPDMLSALTRLMTGGIQVQVAPVTGIGATIGTGGTPKTFKPFLYNAKNKLVNQVIQDMAKEITKRVI
jgi:hypothetical protein